MTTLHVVTPGPAVPTHRPCRSYTCTHPECQAGKLTEPATCNCARGPLTEVSDERGHCIRCGHRTPDRLELAA